MMPLDRALQFAALGWAVMPLHTPTAGGCSCSKGLDCPNAGKHPRTQHGLKDATRDEAVIRQWWDRWPAANIGIVTGAASGLLVVDLDGDFQMPDAIQNAPRSITAKTSRGRHLYFALPPGMKIGNRAKLHGLPIDIRADGGYVVAPGSRHASGARYEWIDSPDDAQLADLPQELLEWLTPSPPVPPVQAPRTPQSFTPNGRADIMTRARSYMAKCPPAVQGSNGSGTLMATLRLIRANFPDLDGDQYRTIAREYSDRCQPPWSEKEIDHAIESIAAKPTTSPRMNGCYHAPPARGVSDDVLDSAPPPDDAPWTPPEPEPRHFPLTDLGNGERFAAQHGAGVRHSHPWRRWLVWDGRRWKLDDSGATMALAKQTVMRMFREAKALLDTLAAGAEDAVAKRAKALVDWAHKSQDARRLAAMLTLAQSEPGIPVLPDVLDSDSWSFNCMNGTLDLRSGELREHRQEDLITKLAPVRFDAAAKCPTFFATVNAIFGRDDELIQHVHRFLGYCLTAVTSEHLCPVAFGTGSNGKTLLMNTVLAVMGKDYAGVVPPELLMRTHHDQHPTIKADLHGKRLMVAAETGEGAKLNEERLKSLTGGNSVKARRCREDYWEFTPSHKIIVETNHRPRVSGQDHGIWRRLALWPFTTRFWDPEKGETGPTGLQADKGLAAKLAEEAPGILNWLVQGCLDWQRYGLAVPKTVLAATSEYRSAEDRLGAFLAECCTQNQEFRVGVTELFAAFAKWCERNGEHAGTARGFTCALEERGIRKDPGRRWYLGVALEQET